MKSNQRTAILFAILLFVCGVAVGILAQRYFVTTVVSAKSAEDFRQQYVSEMLTRLHLTLAQTNKLQVILDETKARAKALRDQYHPQMVQIKEEQENRVKSILTPVQIPAYERLVAERERRYKEQQDHDRQEELKREAAHRARAAAQ